MRRLRTGNTKESKKDKLQRRKDMEEIPNQVKKIVLPTLGALILALAILFYVISRPTRVDPNA